MKIYRIAQTNERYSGWIMPDGSIEKVPIFRHVQFVKDNHMRFGIDKKDFAVQKDTDHENKIYQLAFLKGAIRFSCNGSGDMSINGLKSSIYKNIDKIHSIAKNQKIIKFYVYFNSNNEGVQFKMFQSIRDLYNFAFNKKRIIVAFSDVYAIWILPNGELRACRWLSGGGHAKFVQDNLSLFNLTKEEAQEYMFDYYKAAFDKGAVRLSRTSFSLGVEGNLQDIRKYVEKIYSLSKTFKVKEIYLSTPSGMNLELKPEGIYDV